MAVIDIALLSNSTTILDANSANSGDVVQITALGQSSTLLVADVEVEVGSIAGVAAAAIPTFGVMNGGTLTLDQGLLNISALAGFNFDIIGDGNMILDGSRITTGLTNLLTDYNIQYDGASIGSFLYEPPTLGVLDSISFDINGMQAGDEFNVGGDRNWSLNTTTLGGARSAYRNGMLHLKSGGGLLSQRVDAAVPMTQDEANTFFAAQSEYLNPSQGVFIFPGQVVCFAEGTLLLTKDGYRPVEHLVEGDFLILADGRSDKIRWIGCSVLDEEALDLQPNMRPIRLRKDCLAKGYPFADLVVSPQHRIWVNGHAIREMTDGIGGLIAAKHLVGDNGVEVARDIRSVRYYHVLMDNHEVLWSNGLPTESLLIGKHLCGHLAPALRRDIILHVPEAERMFQNTGQQSRFNLLQGRAARMISKSHAHVARSYFDATRLGCYAQRSLTCA